MGGDPNSWNFLRALDRRIRRRACEKVGEKGEKKETIVITTQIHAFLTSFIFVIQLRFMAGYLGSRMHIYSWLYYWVLLTLSIFIGNKIHTHSSINKCRSGAYVQLRTMMTIKRKCSEMLQGKSSRLVYTTIIPYWEISKSSKAFRRSSQNE